MGLRKKILIVEDNEFNRALLVEILSSQYETLEAENGKVGLEILEREKEAVSLILLDIVMPVMNGYEFLDALKANPAIASIPVIVTTQNEGENDEIAALERGASDFVAKPYKAKVILRRVASIIHLRKCDDAQPFPEGPDHRASQQGIFLSAGGENPSLQSGQNLRYHLFGCGELQADQ